MFYFLFSLVQAEPLSLSQTLTLVQTQNPEVQLARLDLDRANLEKLKSLSMLAPSIEAKSSWLDFGEPLEVNLLGDSTEALDCSTFEAFGMGDLCTSFSEPMLLRDAKIYDGSIQAVLPLSALYSIYQGYQANRYLYQHKELETEQLQHQIQAQVIEIYLQSLHLEKIMHFTDDSIRRLEHNQQKVDAFVRQDLLHPLENKRLKKAMAEVSLAKLQAQQGRELLLQQLELLLGQKIEPIPLDKIPIIESEVRLAQTPQMQIAQYQQQAAQAGYLASVGQLVPSVVLLGAMTSAQGQGALTPTEQKYVGIALQGNLNWGQKLIESKQAKLNVEMAKKGVALQEKGLALQAKALKNEWIIAKEQETIALYQVQISEEYYRQQQEKFDQQLITVAELIDAENEHLKAALALSQAQTNVIITLSKYQYTFSQPIQFE